MQLLVQRDSRPSVLIPHCNIYLEKRRFDSPAYAANQSDDPPYKYFCIEVAMRVLNIFELKAASSCNMNQTATLIHKRYAYSHQLLLRLRNTLRISTYIMCRG
jgi:hypothetical protein